MDLSELTPPLRAFAIKRAPADLDPDDIVQEVLVRVLERLPELRDTERLTAFVFQIARNVIADVFRRRRIQPPSPDTNEGEAEVELTACFAPMIARLPEPYHSAIVLTDLEGLTQHEAARRVGLSLSGMKSRVQRGRRLLKQIFTSSCAIELDVRGGVTACEPRPGGCAVDASFRGLDRLPGHDEHEQGEREEPRDDGYRCR